MGSTYQKLFEKSLLHYLYSQSASIRDQLIEN